MHVPVEALLMRKVPCKVCAAEATPFCSVDMNRTVADREKPVFAPSHIAVHYYKCPDCGFLFTPDFDRWSAADLDARVYGQGHDLADPAAAAERPLALSKQVMGLLGPTARDAAILDFGCGNGAFGAALKRAGFSYVAGYDRRGAFQEEPLKQSFDYVCLFEVLSQSRDPAKTLAEAKQYLKPEGVVFLSCALQPEGLDGPNWTYIAPRNRTVSAFSGDALARLAHAEGFRLASFSRHLHCMFAKEPEFLHLARSS